MIDYGLTFTKRGRKAYLALTGKELRHFFCSHFLHLLEIFLPDIIFPKFKKNDTGKLIWYYLAFQGLFPIKRDGGIILPGLRVIIYDKILIIVVVYTD